MCRVGNPCEVAVQEELFAKAQYSLAQCYSDALGALENQPLAGMVSPSLMGTYGVVPLTIISTLHDINKHMANCIVRAKKEVFLATNFCIHSDASIIITNALRELSKRAGERVDKVVVKIIYDRGSPKQVFNRSSLTSRSGNMLIEAIAAR